MPAGQERRSFPPSRQFAREPPGWFAGLQIVGELGRGEAAVVYLARRAGSSRLVALKLMRPAVAVERSDLERFLAEGRTAARLPHPGGVPVLDFGQVEGTLFLVTAYMSGGSLKRVIEARRLGAGETAMAGSQVAGLLAAYHRAGVVHGGVKPSNILLDSAGMPFLAEVGVASLARANRLPGEPPPAGTREYMAPELGLGWDPSPASDVYALGVTLYECLVGRPPFGGPDPRAVLHQHRFEPVPPLPEGLPPGLADAVLRALAKHPDERYQDAAGLAQALVRSVHCRPIRLVAGAGGAMPAPADVDPGRSPSEAEPPGPREERSGAEPGAGAEEPAPEALAPEAATASPGGWRPLATGEDPDAALGALGWVGAAPPFEPPPAPGGAGGPESGAAAAGAAPGETAAGFPGILEAEPAAAPWAWGPAAPWEADAGDEPGGEAAEAAGEAAEAAAAPWEANAGGEPAGEAAEAAAAPWEADAGDEPAGEAAEAAAAPWEPRIGAAGGTSGRAFLGARRPATGRRRPLLVGIAGICLLAVLAGALAGRGHLRPAAPGGQGHLRPAAPAAATAGWEELGGSTGTPPAVVASGPRRLDLFEVGLDRNLYRRSWDGRRWSPAGPGWEPLGAPPGIALVGSPGAVARPDDQLDVFAVGVDHGVYERTERASRWMGWEALGGSAAGDPAVVSWGERRLDAFVVGDDGLVYHKYWDGAAWHPAAGGWEVLAGGPQMRSVSALIGGPDRIDVFATGVEGAAYHKYWDGSWHPSELGWEALGGSGLDHAEAVSWAPGRLDVFALGTGAIVYHKYWDGAWKPTATGWEPLGTGFVSDPAPVSGVAQRLDVFALGGGRALFHKALVGATWSPSGLGWDQPDGLAGAARGGTADPVAVAGSPGRIDLFVLTGGAVAHRSLDLPGG